MSVDLKDLCSQLDRCNLQNAEIRELMLARLRGERDRMKHAGGPLWTYLGAAAVLVRSVDLLPAEEADEVQAITRRIVALVAKNSEREQLRTHGRATSTGAKASPSALKTLNSMALGGMMIELGFLTEAQVSEALDEARTTGRRFGETVIKNGMATIDAVDQALALQRAMVGAGPARDTGVEPEALDAPGARSAHGSADQARERRLGELLMERSKIDRQGLERALELQRQTGKDLADVLVETGMASEDDVLAALARARAVA